MKGRRTERIDIRVTPEAKAVIQSEAQACGYSVADYILLCVQNEINSCREPGERIHLVWGVF